MPVGATRGARNNFSCSSVLSLSLYVPQIMEAQNEAWFSVQMIVRETRRRNIKPSILKSARGSVGERGRRGMEGGREGGGWKGEEKEGRKSVGRE